MTKVSEAMAAGVRHHQAGRLREAEQSYREVLRIDPGHPDPLHLLGLIAHQIGKHDAAIDLIARAIQQRPDVPEFHESMASACLAAGKPEDAEREAREALEVNPDSAEARLTLATALKDMKRIVEAHQEFVATLRRSPGMAEAHNGLGMVQRQTGEVDEAVTSYRKAIEIRPDYAEAHNNLANALRLLGRLDEAIDVFRRAIELNPGLPELHDNLGLALFDAGRYEESAAAHDEAIQRKPDFILARRNRGAALREAGRLEEANAEYRRALALEPESGELHFCLGVVCQRQGLFDDAEVAYRESVRLAPDHAEAWNNFGNVLKELREVDEAEAAYRRVLELNPDYYLAHGNLANIFRLRDDMDGARECFRQVRRLRPDEPLWELRMATLCPAVFGSVEEIDRYHEHFLAETRRIAEMDIQASPWDAATHAGEPSFNLQFDRKNLRPLKDAYADAIARFFPREEVRLGSGRRRIGFVVTRGHEGVFLRSLRMTLRRMDPKRFDPIVVCDVSARDLIRRAFPTDEIGMVCFADPFPKIVDTIREARFDVLYYREVGTDLPNYFLPFFRLAPVQCTSFGIQVTSGIPNMDYYISSALVEPADAAGHYRERLILSDTLLPYRDPVKLPPTMRSRESFGFATREHLYVCAHQLGKIHPDFDDVIAAILRRDGSGRMVFTSDAPGHLAAKVKARFARTIPDIAARITFLPNLGLADYMSLTALADVLLDPIHFGGMNTSYDGLGAGRPIVTLPSPYHRGRYALGCYRKMEYTECVASDVEDYVSLAVSLGTDRDRRDAVRKEIARRNHLLFEDERTIAEHERIFQEMIDRVS